MIYKNNTTIENIINKLQKFWSKKGCITLQSFDREVGAGTFHHATFFKILSEKNWKTCYTQITKRPQDGFLKSNPTKKCIFHQYQVIIKPPLKNIEKIYLNSLNYIGLQKTNYNIFFLEDNWKSPTLAAHGVGWEVRINGLEISQITYFQKMGGIKCEPTTVEITYGLERIALIIQKKTQIDKTIWTYNNKKNQSFEWKSLFKDYENELILYNNLFLKKINLKKKILSLLKYGNFLVKKKLIYIAFDILLNISHTYNYIETKKNITSIEKKKIIIKINNFAKNIARKYLKLKKK